MNYYNEFDPFAAAWLRELIANKLIPDGVVDERDTREVQPNDLREFTQCHFFAGIGGWSYTLQLAGWPTDRPVWTGSAPCQPFSTAGKQKGTADERHLWPQFFRLIRECQPPTVFGEQVAAAVKDSWFDSLQSDMEAEGYATGMVILPACSIGAPHKRDRLWFVADSINQRSQRRLSGWKDSQRQDQSGYTRCSSSINTVGDSKCDGQHEAEIGGSSQPSQESRGVQQYQGSSTVYCRDGKYRPIPVEPALQPLAYGVPNRVGLLRGAGNAIVPQVAAEVIKAFMESDYTS